jgi:3-hydroxybutyryl-CoA dehydratase
MQVGETRIWERTFSARDVRQFGQIAKDNSIQHMIPDEQGRLMVHDLLIATLPTRLDGELNYIARNVSFVLVHPVFVGDTVRCEITITQLAQEELHTRMSATFICRNQKGQAVLMGNTSGFIRKPQLMNVGLL